MQDSKKRLIPYSFCTLSSSLRHDYVAIWAHLKLIFEWVHEFAMEKITVVHLLSDGPATQYKNRSMFYVISNFITKFLPHIKCFTWNYSVAGHGKGG